MYPPLEMQLAHQEQDTLPLFNPVSIRGNPGTVDAGRV